jgi:hypothetical protein
MYKGIRKKINLKKKRKRKMENLQDLVHGFSFIGSLRPYSCPCTDLTTGQTDLSELEDAISCDLKVQLKFQTDFFCLCMPSTLHKYKCARQRDLQKDVSGFSSFGRLKTCRSTEKRIWANWRMQFHVIRKFKWSFKLIFFASVCHPRCTSI